MVSPGEAPSYGRRDLPESETRRVPMRRLPLVLSATALVVAVFGSTPVGHAVGSAIPAFAKSAGYAKQAGNASALNGIKASKQPRPGALLPARRATAGSPRRSGSSGRPALPGRRATGATGERPARSAPKGATGPAGPVGARGPSGVSGWSYLTKGASLSGESFKTVSVDCPAGKKAFGGGVAVTCRAQGDARHPERAERSSGDGLAARPSRTTRRTSRHRSTSGRSARASS